MSRLVTPLAHFLYHLSHFAPGLIDFVNRLGRRRRIAKNAARLARETAPPIIAPAKQPSGQFQKAA